MCVVSKTMKLCARFCSCVGDTTLQLSWTNLIIGGKMKLIMDCRTVLSLSSNCAGIEPWKTLSTMCWKPMRCGSKYTMPFLEIVAGDATSTSMGSMMVRMFADMAMISPLLRQSFLFSSMTVFMFSIQTASTGPSNTNHLRSSVWFLANSRKSTATIPSVHSCEISSKHPYKSLAGIDLGFRRAWCTTQPACTEPSFARSVKAF
mmetsp:Transcript_66781/g.204408  ORF Transcript_66781/g.204408 Transcript_66781/m.204408 type:complete len:204 (+) Transcript_66781:670-1281(+)